MPDVQALSDAQARLQAETTFDRNVVVVAGAGTGKTTLLVNRLINLLMREPDPLPIMRVVALTFTNKAATEMKARLRGRLAALARPARDGERDSDPGLVSVADLRARYALSTEAVAARAAAALQDLEKAQIGTLHSFAAHLLRLYPLESGVDPAFQEDEGMRFEELFAEHWDLWVDRELGRQGADHARWRRVLAKTDLASLRLLARALCSELVPLQEVAQQTRDDARNDVMVPALRAWLAAGRDRAAALLAAHDRPKRRKAESMLAAAERLLGLVAERGLAGRDALGAAEAEELARDLGAAPVGWSEAEFSEAAGLLAAARQVLQADHPFFQDVVALLQPLAEQVRRELVATGWISFDGLLARARALVREHPRIRERLKRDYRALLVDEFQDTDPVQYEILLYLAERPGRSAAGWQDVELEPGKLFIVGDPKQSIYAFRRADIEAFERVVTKIRDGGGLVCDLTTNFRSHAAVLEVVNEAFDRLFVETRHLQPRNVRLLPRPNRAAQTSEPGVALRIVQAKDEAEALDAQAAARAEADDLARWLKRELFGRVQILDAQGRGTPVQPGHVALLFRKLTQAQDYLEALRRHGILYVTDGEKHFYRRQEVVDLINLLRCIENPHDHIALVGVLRSALGGLPDRELCALKEREALDYRLGHQLAGWDHPAADAVRHLYGHLEQLHRLAPSRPLPEVIDLLFARLPLLELAAASVEGEQAVANLLKVRDIAAELADRPRLTLPGFVDLMIERLGEPPDEAESALAEESIEAVRVLTIHKAKGLEFPVVVLPGLHQGTGGERGLPPVGHDWSSGALGLALGDRLTLGAILVGAKQRAREQAERRRLFYVGMTRARDTLVLSGAITRRPDKGSILAMLEEATGEEIGGPERPSLRIGAREIARTLVAVPDRVARPRQSEPAGREVLVDWPDLLNRWERRDVVWTQARATPCHVTPSRLGKVAAGLRPAAGRLKGDAEQARLTGILVHRVLEAWDFAGGVDQIEARLTVAGQAMPEDIREEARDLLSTFLSSEPYKKLQRAEILGREAPFCMPWEGEGHEARGEGSASPQSPRASCLLPPASVSVMDGVIDLVYRLDDQVWIADYKTDRVKNDEVAGRVAEYRPQMRVYAEAVQKSLGISGVKAQVIFLRNGLAVEVT